MPRYEVQIDTFATLWVEVEAENEDAAHDAAKDEAYDAMNSEWEIDATRVDVMQVRELKDES
jgi:hypothetical protein